MKIVICGGGQVGVGIARQLLKENKDVTIIDEFSENITRINKTLDVSTIHGFPSHPDILEEAGLENAEMVIAVTLSDEVNMIICQIAHSLFNVPIKIARIRKRNYLDPIWKGLYRKDHLPIDHIISPELEVAKTILNRLHAPGAMDSLDFADGKIKILEVRCQGNFQLKNMNISEIKTAYPNLFFEIVAIYRDGQPFLPQISDKILENDEIFFACEESDIKQIMPLFGHDEEEARRLIIVGGGNIGMMIADKLANDDGLNVKIIEYDEERASYIAAKLDNVTVINGNVLDPDILTEAGVSSSEAIVAVTNDDEVNILSCILAKKSNCTKSVCLINKGRNYLPLISTIGIDVDINPRETTVSSILQHIRKGKVKKVNSLYSGQMEVIEVEVLKDSSLIGMMINDIKLPNGAKFFAILSDNGKIFAPTINTIIQKGDTMYVIIKTEDVDIIDRLFSERSGYF